MVISLNGFPIPTKDDWYSLIEPPKPNMIQPQPTFLSSKTISLYCVHYALARLIRWLDFIFPFGHASLIA